MALTPREHHDLATQHAHEGTAEMAIYHTLARIAEALEDLAGLASDIQVNLETIARQQNELGHD